MTSLDSATRPVGPHGGVAALVEPCRRPALFGEPADFHVQVVLGYAHQCLNQFSDAVTCYQRAIDHRRELGDRYYEAATLHRLGDAHVASGNPMAAVQAWRAALNILDTLGHSDAGRVRDKLHGSGQSPENLSA